MFLFRYRAEIFCKDVTNLRRLELSDVEYGRGQFFKEQLVSKAEVVCLIIEAPLEDILLVFSDNFWLFFFGTGSFLKLKPKKLRILRKHEYKSF